MRIPFTMFEIGRSKAIPTVINPGQLQAADSRGWFRIFESVAGAWQRNVEVTIDNVTTHSVVFACVSIIAGDIAKMSMRLVQEDDDGVWSEVESPAFSPVLRKPNHFQTRIQFYQSWMYSKLLFGNAWVLKVRDNRSVVRALYVLDPSRVTPLVAPNSDVFYELKDDKLSQLPPPPEGKHYVVPASEIIHDRTAHFFHPLVGLSPIYACGTGAVQGLNITNNSTNFFGNGSLPGGVLTAPGNISQATADRLKTHFDTSFSGDNAGKVAVLGDGLHFEPMVMKATDSQLIQQLKMTGETICQAFAFPGYKLGLGPLPSYNNIEALNREYWSQCLQIHTEGIELCLDEGLGLTTGDVASERFGTEFDKDDLLTMDSATMMDTLEKARSYLTANEGRRKLGYKRVVGGDAVLRQQQDFSLEALSKRDAQDDPFSTAKPAAEVTTVPQAQLPAAPPEKQLSTDEAEVMLDALWRKNLLSPVTKVAA